METNLILALLRLTTSGPTATNQLSEELRIPGSAFEQSLNSFAEEGLLHLQDGVVKMSAEQRFRLSVLALREGADVERVCKALDWREFEDMAAFALDCNGFATRKHFRFRSSGRRYEIDVLGLREPLVLSVDCKHWRRSWQRAATVRFVEAQRKRTEALANLLPTVKDGLGVAGWREVRLMPLILTLSETPLKVYREVSVVPIFHLQSFLNEMEAHMDRLAEFKVEFTSLRKYLPKP